MCKSPSVSITCLTAIAGKLTKDLPVKLEASQRLQASETSTSFLPDRLVMIDCEMTGLNFKTDDVIQIAALKLERIGSQYVSRGEPLNLFLHTDLQPHSEFARTHMIEVYKKANASDLGYEEARDQLKEWLGDWWSQVSPVGDCVPTDIRFLAEKGVISTSYYEQDTPVPGTFHFEFFEINPLKLVARTKVGYKFDKELKVLPGAHDALIDCYNQLTELNAILETLL